MHDGENKALGVGYKPETDNLQLLTSVNFSKKGGEMRTGLTLCVADVREETPNPLTCCILLSQIARFYDPIGLASPAKQKRVMLVLEAFQEAGKDDQPKDTWDATLSPRLRETARTLFEKYVRLGQVRLERSLMPPGDTGPPTGITSDGSESSYGAVLSGKHSLPQSLEPSHNKNWTVTRRQAQPGLTRYRRQKEKTLRNWSSALVPKIHYIVALVRGAVETWLKVHQTPEPSKRGRGSHYSVW